VTAYGKFPKADEASGPAGKPLASPPPSRGNSEDAASLKDIFSRGDPKKDFCCVKLFSLPRGNPEFLSPADGEMENQPLAAAIVEKDGIPYIDDDACTRDKGINGKLDANFAKLVESVIYSKSASGQKTP